MSEMSTIDVYKRQYYNTSNAYNEKVQEDSSIGWMGSRVFYMTEAAEHLQEDGKPTLYTVCLLYTSIRYGIGTD